MAALRHQGNALGDNIRGSLAQQLLPIQGDGTAARLHQSNDGTKGGGLTGAVCANQGDNGAVGNLQGDALNRLNAAIVYNQVFNFKHRFPPPDMRR